MGKRILAERSPGVKTKLSTARFGKPEIQRLLRGYNEDRTNQRALKGVRKSAYYDPIPPHDEKLLYTELRKEN